MNTKFFTLYSLSAIISTYFRPLTFVLITSWFINVSLYQDLLRALVNPTILVVCLLPGIVFIKRQKARHHGWYSRGMAFGLLMIGFFGAILIYIGTHTPDSIIQDSVIAFGVILVTMLINRFWWDISFHATIPMCCVALLVPVSTMAAALSGLLALLVGISRVPLRQHTLLQVVVGWTFGFGLTWLLLVGVPHIYLVGPLLRK
jgi:membrane-associated phospholipid phosphatase